MKKNYLLLLLMTAVVSTAIGQVDLKGSVWKFANDGGALGIGPNKGDISWFNLGGKLEERACQLDDEFKFNADGSYENDLGDATWLEPWQEVEEGCGPAVAPWDGSAIADWAFDADKGEITINGKGAFIGLNKVFNGGELKALTDDVPATITYPVEFSNDGNTMTIDWEFEAGKWWHFELEREIVPVVVDEAYLKGSVWKFANDGGALGIGPNKGDISWFNLGGKLEERACQLDDEFKFNADGSYENDLGDATWLEPWQEVEEGCGPAVAPWDGSAIADWAFDADKGEITINGKGAFIGLNKVFNGGELKSLTDEVPATITYPVEFSASGKKMIIDWEFEAGKWWHFELVLDRKEIDNSSVKTFDKNLFKVYPNPANNEITVSSTEKLTKVTIYDVTGKVMYTSSDVNLNSTVNVSAFSRGIYVVEVLTDNKTSVKRLILE